MEIFDPTLSQKKGQDGAPGVSWYEANDAAARLRFDWGGYGLVDESV